MYVISFFFFFSSRRRHTRLVSDWSSDVCSSDLRLRVDYWSDTVKPSIVLDSKADLVAYGMGEETILEIAKRLKAGKTVKDLRDLPSVAYALGGSEAPPPPGPTVRHIPSFEEVKSDKDKFLKATAAIHGETNPYNAKTIVQFHGSRAV